MAPAQTSWYVATNGTGGGTSWANATNSLQGAIVASTAGDTVWVSNGVYEAGGITNFPAGTVLTNRVAIYKTITVRSANNDPTNTIIKGAGPNGPAAVRCVYMTNGSSLIGFTLTNGATGTAGTDRYGGGLYCESTNTVISNCVITGNSAVFFGGANSGTLRNCIITRNSSSGATGGAGNSTLYDCTISYNSSVNAAGVNSVIAYNCTIISNTASGYAGGVYYAFLMTNCTISYNSAGTVGGGARDSMLYNCTLSYNSAVSGGGAYYGSNVNCTFVSNSATSGGGAYYGSLTNCILTRNSAQNGGGANNSTLYNCTLTYNSASDGGGGTYNAILYNCILTGNSAATGGGTRIGTSYNCSIVGNSSVGVGGGVYVGTMFNCISWNNNNVDTVGTYNYSCGAGYTNGGSGNITNDPLFITNGSGYGTNHVAGDYHLSIYSPALNAGTNFSWMTDPADARSKDLDDRRRIDNFSRQVDMGCYELMPSGTMFTFH